MKPKDGSQGIILGHAQSGVSSDVRDMDVARRRVAQGRDNGAGPLVEGYRVERVEDVRTNVDLDIALGNEDQEVVSDRDTHLGVAEVSARATAVSRTSCSDTH